MKCLLLNGSESDPSISFGELPEPSPNPGEVLVEVWAAGVIPTEMHWQPTWNTEKGGRRNDIVPAHEFSGVVAAVGADVRDCKPGQEIYGMNDWFVNGAVAEYCIAKPADISPKPANLSHEEAASVPISALTAWQGLFEHAGLRGGQLVLVHGAAGSVGAYAVQLAKSCGAYVVGSASAHDREFVLSLGADRVVDYRSERFEDSVKDVDIVFDTVGGETLDRSWVVLRPGGRLVTVAYSAAEGAGDERVRNSAFIVKPSGVQLGQIAERFGRGELRAFVQRVLPLSESPQAYAGDLPKQKPGKIVVSIRG